MNCLECGCEIQPPKRKFCCRPHSLNWRAKERYKGKFTNKHRSSSPRAFMGCLAKKKRERRDLSVDFLVELYETQGGMCALTGKEMTYTSGEGRVPTNISIDQIIPSAGYTPENIRLVCVQANKMKMELTDADLLSWSKSIVKHLEGK